jgi:L-tyrosine peroxygenase
MMRGSRISAALALPGTDGWDYGDFPYAVEPLTLPHPSGAPFLGSTVDADLQEAYLRMLSTVCSGYRTEPTMTDAELKQLFWFRWITGHHMSFIIWRLLAEDLRRLDTDDGDRPALSAAITEYVRGYNAMLLYTGSSTRAIYNDTIRPSMYRVHPAFSGTWSADYAAVRGLLRGRKVPPVAAAGSDELLRQIKLGQQIHIGVASKLVVGGRSLLQDLVDDPAAPHPRAWSALFDCYFLTMRAPVSGRQLLAQLLRRSKAVAIDLATNGLYPAVANYPEGVSDELRSPGVLDCEQNLIDIVLRIAGLATSSIRLRRLGSCAAGR